jgi:hypothetical protein
MKLCPLLAVFPLLFARTILAQQNVAEPPATSTPATQTTEPPEPQNKPEGRLFGVLPNRLTIENASQLPPMTAGQKFGTTARDAFDPVQFVWYGLLAGISQAEDSDHTYGQGAEGYGKRYGQQFGDGTIENLSTRAIFPSLLHQDPRYFQLGKGSVRRRVWYSVSRVFVTLGDDRKTQFNYSEILGSASAAAISTYAYHPADDKNVGTVMTVWGEQVGYDALSFLAKEFWPDIRRRFSHHRKSEAGSPATD